MSIQMLPSSDGRRPCALAVERGPRVTRALVDALTPVIRARVKRTLRRRGAPSRRDLREEVLDLTQQVFLVLLSNEGHLLRSWDPSRGLSLVNFVGLVAEQQVTATFRGEGSSHRRDELVPPEDLDGGCAESCRSPERLAASREGLEAVFDAARSRLGARGLELFQALFIEARSVDEVCAATGMNADAVYAWRSRLGRLLRTLAKEMLSDG